MAGTSYEILSPVVEDRILIRGEDVEKLEASLYIPSAMHCYSLAIEYIRDWFLSKFDNPHKFKTVYVNGSHILNEYKRYSIISKMLREKPMVAITPTIDMDYNRDMQDAYMGGKDMFLTKFNHHKSFFRDVENNIFLGFNTREQKVQFNFKCRVESRSQQLDLLREMEIAFKIGFTHKNRISADFHIPLEIMFNLARHAGFEVIKEPNGRETITDIVGFISYVNAHSEFPVMYKLRSLTGRNEFFMRVKGVYAHISNLDPLNYDDGERQGQLDNNFHVEMNCYLDLWVPQFYVYKSRHATYKYVKAIDSDAIGLWTCKIVEIPDINEKGWGIIVKTDYDLDPEDKAVDSFDIDISPIFLNKDLYTVIKLNLKMGISPSRFIDIKTFAVNEEATFDIDWEKMIIKASNVKEDSVNLGIYLDSKYKNDQMIIIKDMKTTRLE